MTPHSSNNQGALGKEGWGETENVRVKANIVSDPAKIPPWNWKTVIFFWTHLPDPKSLLSWGKEVCSPGEKFQRKQNVPRTETLAGGKLLAPWTQTGQALWWHLGAVVKPCLAIQISPLPRTCLHKWLQINMYRRHCFVLLKILTKRRIIKNLKTALDCVQKLKPKKELSDLTS